MSDLISRSELIKHFEAVQSQEDAIGLDFVAIIDEIKEQPTAYDVGKVVVELEERTDFLKNCKKYGNKNAKQQAESYSTMMMYEVADLVDDLSEIVKHGGVSDDVSDDVCEWKSVSGGEFIQNPHTKRLYSNEPSMQNVYCNTCGKKIKVVN